MSVQQNILARIASGSNEVFLLSRWGIWASQPGPFDCLSAVRPFDRLRANGRRIPFVVSLSNHRRTMAPTHNRKALQSQRSCHSGATTPAWLLPGGRANSHDGPSSGPWDPMAGDTLPWPRCGALELSVAWMREAAPSLRGGAHPMWTTGGPESRHARSPGAGSRKGATGRHVAGPWRSTADGLQHLGQQPFRLKGDILVLGQRQHFFQVGGGALGVSGEDAQPGSLHEVLGHLWA